MTKLKKVVAGILAAAAMATSVVGMSASAYSPTVSRTVGSVTKPNPSSISLVSFS